jgi:hypothetical protein
VDGPAVQRGARPVGPARARGRRVARCEPQGVLGHGAAWGRHARPREAQAWRDASQRSGWQPFQHRPLHARFSLNF